MYFDREHDSHELFIGTTTAMHPNASLRFSANVLGKYCVDPKLSAKAATHLRNIAAAEQEVGKDHVDSPLSRSSISSNAGVPSTTSIPAETVGGSAHD